MDHPLFDWLDASNAERCQTLAEVLLYIAETLDFSAHSAFGQDYVLSKGGAAGLAHLLHAMEQSLRCDVSLPQQEG